MGARPESRFSDSGRRGPTGTGEVLSAPASGEGTAASVEQSIFATAPATEYGLSHSASVALPGPRSCRSGAGEPRRPEGTPCRSRAQAARSRSTHLRTATDLRLAPVGSVCAIGPHALLSAQPAGFAPPVAASGSGASPQPVKSSSCDESGKGEVTASHSNLRLSLARDATGATPRKASLGGDVADPRAVRGSCASGAGAVALSSLLGAPRNSPRLPLRRTELLISSVALDPRSAAEGAGRPISGPFPITPSAKEKA
jgi:hypothetical protein